MGTRLETHFHPLSLNITTETIIKQTLGLLRLSIARGVLLLDVIHEFTDIYTCINVWTNRNDLV